MPIAFNVVPLNYVYVEDGYTEEELKLRDESKILDLEPLKGKRQDQYSIRVNDQWRVCFRWTNGDAHEVEVCDYHDE